MLGSIVSDFLNNGFYEIDIGKAFWTACIATVFSTLAIIMDDYVEKEKTVSLLMNSVNLYISMWISTANSIIGAF